jgi:protein arginine kinase activator
MDHTCDNCDKDATVHLTEFVNGQKVEKHFCPDCAAEMGLTKPANTPFGDAMPNFEEIAKQALQQASEMIPELQDMLAESGIEFGGMHGEFDVDDHDEAELPAPEVVAAPEPVVCEMCGLSFEKYQSCGRLGCAHDYTAFKDQLDPMLEGIHGATRHAGKVPAGFDKLWIRESNLLELKRKLEQAIKAEQYELAAELRDEISQMENES